MLSSHSLFIDFFFFRKKFRFHFLYSCFSRSHFNHIFLVVTPVKSISDSPHYRIEMLTNDTLRAFGPAFKSEPIYQHSSAFGNMLLAKSICFC